MYQHALMKFESTSNKLDHFREVLRRPYSPPMAIKVENIISKLETVLDDMENSSCRLYHLQERSEYEEYEEVKIAFENYYLVANLYMLHESYL